MCPVELPLQLDHLGRVVGSGTGRIGDRDGQKQLYAIMFYPSMRIFYHRFFRRRRFLTAAGAFAHIESVPESGAQSIGLWNPPPETLDTATPENRNSDRPRRCGTAGIAKPDLRRRRLPTMRSIPQQSTSCDLAHYFPEPPPTPAPGQIDAPHQHRPLLLPHHHFPLSAFRFSPPEPALLQTFGAYPQSPAVPEHHL